MPDPISARSAPSARSVPGEREMVNVSSDNLRELIVQQATAWHRLSEELASFRGLYEQQHETLLAQLRLPMCVPHAQSGPHPQSGHAPHVAVGMSNQILVPARQVSGGKVGAAPKKSKRVTRNALHKLSRRLSESENSLKRSMAMLSVPSRGFIDYWMHVHLKSFVLNLNFELSMGFMILLNVVMMAFHLQLEGYGNAQKLGLRGDDGGLSQWEAFFGTVDKLFTGLFLMELLLRMVALRRAFFKEGFNVVDMMIVVGSCVEAFILEPLMKSGTVNLSILRFARFLRIFRILKIMRVGSLLGEIRVLVRTIAASLHGLSVSVLLIGGIVVSGAILMVQLSHLFLTDESIDIEHRQWLYGTFGNTARSVYTMFECTFTGGWRFYSRPCIEDIHVGFAVFWVLYVICVNFSVMRVVGALFLKHTLAVAAVDQERLAMEKMKQKEQFATELHAVFAESDTSGDGVISKQEFEFMLENEHVLLHFTKLELELDEVIALFGVLSADDGEVDYQEFLLASLKMKGSARTIDTVQVLHQQFRVQKTVDSIARRLGLPGIHDAHAENDYAA